MHDNLLSLLSYKLLCAKFCKIYSYLKWHLLRGYWQCNKGWVWEMSFRLCATSTTPSQLGKSFRSLAMKGSLLYTWMNQEWIWGVVRPLPFFLCGDIQDETFRHTFISLSTLGTLSEGWCPRGVWQHHVLQDLLSGGLVSNFIIWHCVSAGFRSDYPRKYWCIGMTLKLILFKVYD